MANSTISNINIQNTVYDIEDSTARQVATTSQLGRVKPDGTTFTIDNDGTLHSHTGITKFVDIPVASSQNIFTYDGTEKELVFTSIDTENINVTGNIETNAGDHTAVCTLKSAQYAWEDLTNASTPKTYAWTINKAVLTPPSVSGTLTYSGSPQSPTISSYDSTKIQITGTSATNVGTYTATIHIIDSNNYKWNDGTIADKTATWSIVKAVLAVPTVSGTSKTYTGSPQHPTVTGYDSNTMSRTGYEYTNVGNYTLTFSLVDSNNYEWGSGTTSFAWSIAKAAGAVTLSSNSVTLDASHLSRTVTISGATGAVTITSSDTTIATVSPASMSVPGGTLTITSPNSKKGSSTVTVSVAASTNYNATSKTISITGDFSAIYGAEWDGSSTSAWTRTDGAANFIDPIPAVNNGNGSSPFDNISPWKDIKRVTDATAGALVEIPKFYYKWTKTGSAMKLQISSDTFDGALVSPAHADRGDGSGERDAVYVGRYPCVSGYKSQTNKDPLTLVSRSSLRTNIHNLGSTYWQWDYAMYWTIAMLYLVEFADWNSQAKIGFGRVYKNQVEKNGATDTMAYHTGTNASSRSGNGHTQYRYIEDLWSNVRAFVDGILVVRPSSSPYQRYIYCVKNPADFTDSTSGTYAPTNIGQRLASYGFIKTWTIPSTAGFEYALFPSSVDGSYTTYACDYYYTNTDTTVVWMGGSYDNSSTHSYVEPGLFCLCFGSSTSSDKYTGGRLMKLP